MLNKSGTVGRIMTDMECYIKPVEGIEQGGHLVVKGPNIMQGYLSHDKPGEVQAPATEHGAGWYDTGDIADIDDEGFITILGRAKRFAKIGGEMVSLTSVEELASLTWPDIKHAAVAIYDERKGEKIILYTESKVTERKSLQTTAKEKHMSELAIPKTVIHLAQIPVLGTGKTDYIGLAKLAAIDTTTDTKEEGTWINKLSKLVKQDTPDKD